MITTKGKDEWCTNVFILCVLKLAKLIWVCTNSRNSKLEAKNKHGNSKILIVLDIKLLIADAYINLKKKEKRKMWRRGKKLSTLSKSVTSKFLQ